MDPSQHSVILLVIMVTMLLLLLGSMLWVLHYCRMRYLRRKRLVPGWAGARPAPRDQATSTTSLGAALALLLKRRGSPTSASLGFSSWAELSGRGKHRGGSTSRTLSSGGQGSCSIGLTTDDASSIQESDRLLHTLVSPPLACWRPGLEPSLVSGVQRMPGSTTTVGSAGFVLERRAGSISFPQQQDRLSSSLQSPEIQQHPSLPTPVESPVLGLSAVGIDHAASFEKELSYLSPPSPRLPWQPAATSPALPADELPVAVHTSRESLRRSRGESGQMSGASGVLESGSVPSILTQDPKPASPSHAGTAEVGVQVVSERPLLERARSSSLFQRSRAWFISWAESVPKPGSVGRGGGSVDSGVDVQDNPLCPKEERRDTIKGQQSNSALCRASGGETGSTRGPVGLSTVSVNGTRSEETETEPKGDEREVVICPREAARKLGGASGRSLWQKWEERPLIAIN